MNRKRPEWRLQSNADAGRLGQPLAWDAARVRALRQHLGLTQVELARELGTRQATISEWEHDLYRPRGASARLLGLLAERASFDYEPRPEHRDDPD
jgi:DNA-binding transcriptional regulator YiaG